MRLRRRSAWAACVSWACDVLIGPHPAPESPACTARASASPSRPGEVVGGSGGSPDRASRARASVRCQRHATLPYEPGQLRFESGRDPVRVEPARNRRAPVRRCPRGSCAPWGSVPRARPLAVPRSDPSVDLRGRQGAVPITVLPQASGMATARVPRMTGAFHGAMPSTTPAAWRIPWRACPACRRG